MSDSPTRYRLNELAVLATELGFSSRRVDENRLNVTLEDAVLEFFNMIEESDTLVGFRGTPWHYHGSVTFGTGDATYVDYDEFDLLIGLGLGELLIFSQFVDGVLRDRWIAHKSDTLDDARYLEPGEEVRIYRLKQNRAESSATPGSP